MNIDSDVEGTVFGKKFKGKGHLQKVFGVTILGPFNWSRVLFKNGSVFRFFGIKPYKNSKKYFRRTIDFYDGQTKKITKFNNPKLKIKRNGKFWTVDGQDKNKKLRATLEIYAEKQFIMRGDGPFVYNEYAVLPKEFYLKTKGKEINLNDLGGGVGTFEDTYWRI